MADAKSGATPLEGSGKRILMVYGTPKTISLCHALAEAYTQGARSEGHVVRVLKLGELDFDPVLHSGYEQSQTLEHDLLEAQRQIHWAEHLVFVYPVWWGGLPALLTGFSTGCSRRVSPSRRMDADTLPTNCSRAGRRNCW